MGSVSMYLSEAERALVLATRVAVEAEVRIRVEQADVVQSELTSANRYLKAENKLAQALINHGICPPWPESQL
jgi:hypothetical protein